MIDSLAGWIERGIALLGVVSEQIGAARASMLDLREWVAAGHALESRSRLHRYWYARWPKDVFPSVQDWQTLRREIEAGSIVLAYVGSLAPAVWVRLVSITPEAEPTNAEYIGWLASDESTPQVLCPKFGETPRNAVWEAVVFGSGTGA